MTDTKNAPLTHAEIDEAARAVLRANDLGHMVTAAPMLYPHQWSWDAAFVAIGLAHMSVPRATAELGTLFDAQWSTGMIPHIVFSDTPGYYPGPDVWQTDRAAAKADGVQTSGICQPPVHAIAVARILDIATQRGGEDQTHAEEFVRRMLPRLDRWHQWLLGVRDPSERNAVEIHHGWESGMDNSPRWDSAYQAVRVPHPIELRRHDTRVVANEADRPSDEEYQRYLRLVNEMASVDFDDDRVNEVVQFRVCDVFMTALLAVAADEAADLADRFAEPDIAASQRTLADRARQGVLATVDEQGRCRDFDVRADAWVETESVASWSLLICGGDDALWRRQRDELAGPRWSGHPSLAYAVPPSVSPDDPGFRPRTYWRGPAWPFLTWLLAWAVERQGDAELGHRWRDECLDLLADGSFGEYYDPQTGLPAGSHDQSWSAAVAIDWIASAH